MIVGLLIAERPVVEWVTGCCPTNLIITGNGVDSTCAETYKVSVKDTLGVILQANSLTRSYSNAEFGHTDLGELTRIYVPKGEVSVIGEADCTETHSFNNAASLAVSVRANGDTLYGVSSRVFYNEIYTYDPESQQ